MDTSDDKTQSFETQARRMWTTRPVRLPRAQSPDTWFFGVCEGIAVRYQVSPTLVRLVVGLSVTLGGLGLWFYLVALLVMPRYGVPLSPAKVRRGRTSGGVTQLSITICQGKNRQVRRMCGQAGLKVLRLKRVREGGLCLDRTLGPGKWRRLEQSEVASLLQKP